VRAITVPLNVIQLEDDGFHLIAEIIVFKQKLIAVIDTGASRSVFDKTLIESQLSQLEHTEGIQATTLFTTSDTVIGIIPELKLGRLLISDYSTIALDLSAVNTAYERLGHPAIAAIIGCDLLHKYQAVINYRNRKMYLRNTAS
jgi:hypothetical protein